MTSNLCLQMRKSRGYCIDKSQREYNEKKGSQRQRCY